jgi:hypothetical protein
MKNKFLITILSSVLWIGGIEAQLKVGDKHPTLNGVVAVLNADGTGLVIGPGEKVPSTWDNAKVATAKIGNGWYLPTLEQMQAIYANNSILKIGAGFTPPAFWCRGEMPNNKANAMSFSVPLGTGVPRPKTDLLCVRRVHAF